MSPSDLRHLAQLARDHAHRSNAPRQKGTLPILRKEPTPSQEHAARFAQWLRTVKP